MVAIASVAALKGDGVQQLKPRATVKPVVSGTPQVLGVVEDPKLNRDSCTSTRVGKREFWTCRDSESYPGHPGFFYTSTASWTDFNPDGTPAVKSHNLTCFGDNTGTYFKTASGECPTSGFCKDGTRWAIWPDTRPLPVDGKNGAMSLYSWIRDAHVKGLSGINGPAPPTSLYRSNYDGSNSNALPSVTLISAAFYPTSAIAFGNYGWVIHPAGGTAYLYGHSTNGVALARVPLGSIENKSKYQYYYPATKSWSSKAPAYSNKDVAITHAGTGGQGTFYYSSYFGSYVWIGSPSIGDNSAFQITTAPAPQGPWETPETFYTGPEGTNKSDLVAYSQQAHRGLSEAMGNGKDIYLTYTKVDKFYSTPLVRMQWK